MKKEDPKPDDLTTVLVVAGEEMVLQLVREHLADVGLDLLVTNDSEQAEEALEREEIAVFLCELDGPGIDGVRLLELARGRQPRLIAMALGDSEEKAVLADAVNRGGICRYVAKPWDREELVRVMGEAVDRYSRLRAAKPVPRTDAGPSYKVVSSRTRHRPVKIRAAQRERARPQRTVAPQRPKKIISLKKMESHAAQTRGPLKVVSRRPPRRTVVAGHREAPSQWRSSRYRLIEEIGQGGMGVVYKAEDRLLDMPVAVKVLSQAATRDPLVLSTFKDEARIAMQLSHRHIVRLYNLQKVGDVLFLVMEYVEGESFQDLLGRYGSWPMELVRDALLICGEALAFAHRHGVIHRDLKPANILRGEDGVVKIIDFGVACLQHAQKDSEYLLGTPVYMSPEQLRGEELDARTDVYSMGVIVYEFLTGATPFPRDCVDIELLARGPRELPGLPESVADVVARALSVDRAQRWAGMEEFASAFAAAGAVG